MPDVLEQSPVRAFPGSIDIVVPCHNEAEALPLSTPTVIDLMRSLIARNGANDCRLRLVLVDDGSRDRTWEVIKDQARQFPEVTGIKLARNFGHQNALLGGLSRANAEVVISLDADLQDDPKAMEAMIEKYRHGAEIVFGVREERATDTVFKRSTAVGFYRIMNALGINLVHNHADYRLMSRKALRVLLEYNEVNLFLRGVVASMGFKTAIVEYARSSRVAGSTSYNIAKMLGLALTGLLSFSSLPLRMIAVAGFFASLLSLFIALWVLFSALFERQYIVPGWASLLLPISLFGSLQLLSAGIIGEYIGRIYLEVKRRPRFILDDVVDGRRLDGSVAFRDEDVVADAD
ncbi:glycosyltransferase [uncultured Rhodoblastus sp.]|uniref:glycosyltransferase family 2 protein n=1 Tax=uncultured Rhodoblastus sp. TaxID=543037 RepID=UPI0025D8009D|nr:glycosyltransferase [uncultured Rhodoblastus sp.]